MWKQWKKKILDLFFTEEVDEPDKTPEENRIPIKHNQRTEQEIHTKVMHKYPNRESFRFPVIPDYSNKNKEEKPAFARKRMENKQPVQEKADNKIENKPVIKPEHKKPFHPTEVPSPIYGYHKRKKEKEEEKEMENVPAFVRKQVTEESKIDVNENSTPIQDEGKSKNNPIAVPAHQESTITFYENNLSEIEDKDTREEFSEPAFLIEENDANPEPVQQKEVLPKASPNQSEMPNHDETNEDPILKQSGEDKAVENQLNLKRNTNKQSKRSQSRRTEKNENKQGSVPFNVMMSANDKQKWKQRRQRANNRSSVQTNSAIPYHLLNDPDPKSTQDELWVLNQQELLEQTLKHFHVNAKVVNATQGPSVTRFEVHPEMGVKVSKVKNLSDDLKLNMAAKDIRIEAPIPGKNTIGIEIPNQTAQMVGLQEIFATDEFRNSSSPLTIALGLTIEGSPLITNVNKMPHGLIAGATGSGKSVCINTILVSLLYKASHEDVKFLLIDPKMVELAPFNAIPHLVAPVITDVKAATQALKWAVNEMEERYEKFVREGVRDIERYNQKMRQQNQTDEKMPFLVIVIDELADLMMVSPQDVEDAISRIAQKARACGIHLLLATQRPSVDVITGLIKANIPTRIAFSVSSQVDSRTIIDTSGAEKLLGKGDMLFVENGAGKSVRLQGAFVSDDEIERVTKYARSIAPANYLFEQEQLLEQIAVDDEEDDLLEQAIQFVVQQNSASTSLLQRHFKIGYNRAARLMDTMELKGIIAQQNGSKPREVLISNAQLEKAQE
ncbi:DNA translocase FtsK [Lentibacillus sp. Marseille-P4043]|uniref:DNA translocase FtsK n=1 Tax=Lentibacillus sp. Marseille-P4043 TaxID=2040293 RepID=UPI000D0B276E|nr:DNA translocase FtsK [Lentibacillus sp. Marseille-P4043]